MKKPESQEMIRKYDNKRIKKETLCKEYGLTYFFTNKPQKIIAFIKDKFKLS
jgi:hypothetical protein